MELNAPAVVAVVVTSQPDHRLEETLTSLLAQDYEALQILVMVGEASDDVASRVARVSPGILIARLEEDRGFGAAINRALELIEGSAFLLLCHDDVSLASDAVHLLVEESFRSNAGIVTPKVVTEVDRSVLLHVGQGMDRFGNIVERVLPGEIDQGQHDAVRDVFVAPGGVTLVRDDLLRSLGGFDARYVAMGDDIELSWRARIAGARIVCAPDAVVSHAERLAASERQVPAPPGDEAPPTLARLRRRNEIRLMVTCWRLPRRLLYLVTLAFLNAAEVLVAATGGDHERAVDIRESWRQAVRDRHENRKARKAIERSRTVSDRAIRAMQSPGATRLRTFATTFLHQGFDAARGALTIDEDGQGESEALVVDTSSDLVGFGGAFSDDEGFDELDDLGNRVRRHRGTRRRLSSARSLSVVAFVAVIIFLIGSRDLIGARLPMVGQLVPLGSWGSVWHEVVASWLPNGLGSGAPGHPGYATLGLFGVVTFGQMGALIRMILIFAVPVGAVGVFRILHPVASNRARMLAALAFGGLALGVNDIAAGSVSGLVALGAAPFILRRLLCLAQVAPFNQPFEPPVPFATRGWRRTAHGQVASLGLLLALVSSLAPAVLVTTVAAAIGISAVGAFERGARPLQGQRLVALSVLVALALLAPLVIASLLSGTTGLSIFGAAPGPWSSPGLGGLLRFSVGPNGGGVLAWLLPLAALVPLLIARDLRLALSARMAGVGVVSLGLGLWVSRGGWGAFAPNLLVVLAPLATALAVMVGLGLAALETDVVRAHFGWRQLLGTVGVLAALLGLLPALGSVGDGRWKLAGTGYGDTLGFLTTPQLVGQRILWLGDPRAIPGSSWSLSPGLAWSTSAGQLPNVADLFNPPSAPASGAITQAVTEAIDGQTNRLGQLLAPAGVTAIVVPISISPYLPGTQSAQLTPPPAGVLASLAQQRDLVEVPGGSGAVVFESRLAMSQVATRALPLRPASSPSQAATVTGWTPLSLENPLTGTVPSGAKGLFVGLAPAGDFSISGATGTTSAFGWATGATTNATKVSVSLDVLPWSGLVNLAMVAAWFGVALALLGRHRWLDWWWRRARHPAHGRTQPAVEEVSV
jgi:GT2 family glycosyltransferase